MIDVKDTLITQTSDAESLDSDKPLLSCFLHELTVSRKQLALYPADHPHIEKSIGKTFDILDKLFLSEDTISLGITPDALQYHQLWLDREEPANKEFAHFFSTLGIASISFHNGLKGPELIRFNQLLRADRATIESHGGFEQLLEQQQINHISVIPIDYEAFQSTSELNKQKQELWETFLHGLRNGILDFGEDGSGMELEAVADLLNQAAQGDDEQSAQYRRSFERYIEQRIHQPGNVQNPSDADRRLNTLLQQLQPEARDRMFSSIFQILDRHQEQAPTFLKKVSPQLLQGALARAAQQKKKVSSRLLALAQSLTEDNASSVQQTVAGHSGKLSPDMVKARLEVLFSEEQQDLYMPGHYQSALGQMLTTDIDGGLPEEERSKLKSQLEEQPIEDNFTAILLELVRGPLTPEQENAVQQNLLSLSRHFLDFGHFDKLLAIYQSWLRYLNNPSASLSIFEEKLLTHHTQASFMNEVLDGFDVWDEEEHPRIISYICSVGDPYIEFVIERLGLAPTWEQRKLWIKILETISDNTQDRIVAALDDERWYLIRNLLSVVGRNLTPASIKIIQKHSSHPHPKVRCEAIRILLTCNPATANRQLLAELCSDDDESVLAALEIAHFSKDRSVASRLHELLDRDPDSEPGLHMQIDVVQALARIGNRESLPILNRVIRKRGSMLNRRLKKLQEEAIRSLANFPGEAAEKLLHEQCKGRFKQLARTALDGRRQ